MQDGNGRGGDQGSGKGEPTDPGERLAWFETLYKDAGTDPAKVPWARLAPHPGLEHWARDAGPVSGRAIDVGCGLGDNAEFLASLGLSVTAFDLSASAIDWAKRRFPASSVAYAAADLFDLPKDWIGSFDLVSEVYTLQALPAEIRQEALRAIASLVAPGGAAVVVCMARNADEPADGPPWPLAREELGGFADLGFVEERFSDLPMGESGHRHFVAVYRRPL